MTGKNSSAEHTWLTVSRVDLAHVPRLLLQNTQTWQYSQVVLEITTALQLLLSMYTSRHPAWSVQDSMPFCNVMGTGQGGST
jgi:hypothetical protein